ncbi:hypothetical protein AHF37_05217 [Paragonimus kellicotti]|nr:hypothetical protein AHF37_05217 [Paragonimus kellicotti]
MAGLSDSGFIISKETLISSLNCTTESAGMHNNSKRNTVKTDYEFNVREAIENHERPQTTKAELASFDSSIGVLLSCLGCVVGTGNIWRFPRIIATASCAQGSLTFLIAWVLSLFVWSLPLSIVEYSLGRFSRTSPLGAFHKFLGNKLIWLGGWIVGVTYMITLVYSLVCIAPRQPLLNTGSCALRSHTHAHRAVLGCVAPQALSAYFSVIVGWCLFYLYKSCALPSLPKNEELSTAIFNEFAMDSYWPVLTHTLAVVLVGVCIFGGINWIEKANMVLVPMLLGILIFTFGWSLTRQYAEAASQNAFDTGAAMALFVSYSAYFTRKNGAVRFGTLIPLVNNTVSLLCALTIFSTVFSTLIQTSPTLTRSGILRIMQTNGPGSTGLTFTWIPVLFAYVGGIGRVLCALFFLCLSFAGITSLIGHVQLTVVTLKDLGLSHRKAALTGLLLTLIFGLPSAVSIQVLTNQVRPQTTDCSRMHISCVSLFSVM